MAESKEELKSLLMKEKKKIYFCFIEYAKVYGLQQTVENS